MLPIIDLSSSTEMLSTKEVASRIRGTLSTQNHPRFDELSKMRNRDLINAFHKENLIIREGTRTTEVLRRHHEYNKKASVAPVQVKAAIPDGVTHQEKKEAISKNAKKNAGYKIDTTSTINPKGRGRLRKRKNKKSTNSNNTKDNTVETGKAKKTAALNNPQVGNTTEVQHKVATQVNADPTQADSVNQSSDHKSQTEKVDKKASDIKKKKVTVSGTKRFFQDKQLKIQGSSIYKKMAGNKFAIGAIAATIATGMMISTIGNRFRDNVLLGGNPSTSFLSRKTVLPTSYKEGFNEIKEYTTDFGSRVHLDKTVNKFINRYVSSARKGMITNTKAVMNKNISLSMHKNAINHTRM